MRKLLLLALFILGANFWGKAQQAAVISGKITGNTQQAVAIVAYNNFITYEIDTLTIGKTLQNGEFSVTLMLKQPRFVKFFVAEESFDLYLYPGAELEVYGELFNLHNTLQLKGPASAINRYIILAADKLNAEYDRKTAMVKTEPAVFSSYSDSILKNNLAFLTNYFDTASGKTEHDLHFKDVMHQTLIYSWANTRLNYPDDYRQQHKLMHTPEMPDGYYGFLDTLQIDNPGMAQVPAYVQFINNYTNYQLKNSREKVRGAGKNPAEWKLDYVERTFTEDARDMASATIVSEYLSEENDLDKATAMMKRLQSGNGNSRAYEVVKQQLEIKYSLTPQNPAPNFVLKDENGNEVSLSDFKGKVVYLDFWASWCGPCIREVPYAKKLHSEFNDSDVVFLNVSLDEKEADWQKALQKHGIKGVNLIYSGNRMAGVIKDYGITSIPHYVLIDKQGNIIENKTSRPSENARELILKALRLQ